jgi:tetratricopeptide (TPR) repeat protein
MIRKFLALIFLVLLALDSLLAASPLELLNAGRVNEAISQLRGEIQKSPSAEAYLLLARAYYSEERWEDAIASAQKAVEAAPNHSDAHLWLGRAYGNKAEISNWWTATLLARKVHTEFEKAVQLDPANIPARLDLSEYYVEAPGFLGGGTEKAKAQASFLMSGNPAAAHQVEAMIAEKNKNYALAESHLRSSAEITNLPDRWVDLASFYRRRARLQEMEQSLQRAVSMEPKGTVLFDAAAILCRAGQNFELAISLLKTYLAGDGQSQDAPVFRAHFLLGQLLEKQGDKHNAADQYRAALSLASDYNPAKEALNRVR